MRVKLFQVVLTIYFISNTYKI